MVRHLLLAVLVFFARPAQAQTPAPVAAPITLEQLEERALQSNPTGIAASAGIDAARGRRSQAGAWPNPVIG